MVPTQRRGRSLSCRNHEFNYNVLPETIILHLFKVEELYLIGYNMTSSARDSTNASVLTYHRIIEAFKFGYAWRSRLGDPAFNMDKNISEVSERYRGYYMAAEIRNFSSSVEEKHLTRSLHSLVRYFFQHSKRNFVSPSEHVIYLLCKHQ